MLKLFHNGMSTSSQKVRLCLAEKELQWESVELELRQGEQQSDWYLKLNPRAVVPTLVDDDDVVTESNVINEYLDDKYPARALMPSSPMGRARVRLWTKRFDEGLHDAGLAVLSFAVVFRQQYLAKGQKGQELIDRIPDAVKRERRRDVLNNGFQSQFVIDAVRMLEALVRDMSGALSKSSWLAGESYSLADAAFTPLMARLENLHVLGLIEREPGVADWYRRCIARPSFDVAVRQWQNAEELAAMERAGHAQRIAIRALFQEA